MLPAAAQEQILPAAWWAIFKTRKGLPAIGCSGVRCRIMGPLGEPTLPLIEGGQA